MFRGILSFLVLFTFLNGVFFPNTASFHQFYKKFKSNACELPLSDFEETSDCEKNEEQKTDNRTGTAFEDLLMPYGMSIFFFNNSKLTFRSFNTFLPDHFLEIISPPPKFQ
jgi:hypothetical protein